MRAKLLGTVAMLLSAGVAPAFSQTGKIPAEPTLVTAEEIGAVVNAPGGGDREVKIADLGQFNLGIAVLRREALKAGGPITAISHSKLTEVYYVVSGEGTMVTGGEVKDLKPLAADSELVTTVVGPGNNGIFVKPERILNVKAGDVIVIPAGVYHGFSEVPDHIEYVLVRPDVNKVLPGGYINPILKK